MAEVEKVSCDEPLHTDEPAVQDNSKPPVVVGEAANVGTTEVTRSEPEKNTVENSICEKALGLESSAADATSAEINGQEPTKDTCDPENQERENLIDIALIKENGMTKGCSVSTTQDSSGSPSLLLANGEEPKQSMASNSISNTVILSDAQKDEKKNCGNTLFSARATTQGKGPRAKMTLSPNKVPQTKSIAHYFQAISKGTARKSLSHTFIKSGQNELGKPGSDVRMNGINTFGVGNKEGTASTEPVPSALAQNNQRNPSFSPANTLPTGEKKQPKARKSFQPRASSSRESTPMSIKSHSSASSCLSIANMTIKLPELENALGIKRRSLDNIDAKTLDQIVLAKAKQRFRPVPQQNKSARSLLKPLDSLIAEAAVKEEITDTEPANISAVIMSQKILKKRKKRKLGTYKLPGGKKEYKKKTPKKESPRGWTKRYKHAQVGNGQPLKIKEEDITKEHANLSDSILSVEGTVDTGKNAENKYLQEADHSSVISATETDDSYFMMDRQKKKRKKTSRLSKWQRGYIAKKHPKKANVERTGKIQTQGLKYNNIQKRQTKTNTPLLVDALQAAVKEPTAELKTLNQVIASLSDGTACSLRRSGRKRKATELEDSSSIASSGVDSDTCSDSRKRRKVQIQGEPPSLTLESNTSAVVSIPPGKSPSPPSISPQKVAKPSRKLKHTFKVDNLLIAKTGLLNKCSVKTKDEASSEGVFTQSSGTVPGVFKKRSPEGDLAAVPSAAQGHKQVEGAAIHKFVNTPNGLTYPVTPPKTPDHGVLGLEDREGEVLSKYAGGEKDRDFIPLCCCRVTGSSFTNSKQIMYCQALDSINGKVVGCCNKVTNKQLIRPAFKVPFMAVCELHRQRMKLHQCCPGCGHFCTEGKFYQCQKDGNVIHHFHRQCQVFKDNKYYCPHCGEESLQYEVTLRLNNAHLQASFLSQEEPSRKSQEVLPLSSRARMSVERPHVSGLVSSSSTEALVTLNKIPNKVITSAGLSAPSKKELLHAIAVLEGEKSKKIRVGPKTLYSASKMGDVEKVLLMLVEGVDPNARFEDFGNQTALHSVAEGGSVLVAHILIQAGASPHAIDDDLRTPLMNAAEQGNIEVMKLLIKCGAHIEIKAEDGMTCLHLAAKNGKTEAVRYLVTTQRADVNVTDDGGWTAIIWAAEHRHIDTVKYLLEAGADPNKKDNEENTGLHWAAYAGSVDIAEIFLNAGCNLEGANEHGDRPLHIAARQDHYECVVLFLARGADSEARNNDNEAPISCCVDQESQCWMALRVNRTLKGIAAQRTKPERLLHRDVSMGKEVNAIPVVNAVDDENYPQDFLYVADYVETTPMNVNRVITSLQSCKCRDNCTSVFCVCGRNSVRCWYDLEGRLVKDFNYADPPLVFECNRACRCWSTCQNRVVQLGVTCRLQVFRTEGRGWGARSLLDIPQGTFVCEYIGELISDAEADSREDDSYLFDLDNKDADTFCIDARKYGNISRFVNHRCDPNLTPVKVFVNHQDLRFPRICFFASRDIKAYEELGFDYGEKFWIIKWKQFTCECGSPKCRYSKQTIHTTLEEYNRRQEEELAACQGN